MRAWLITPLALAVCGAYSSAAQAVSIDIKTTETMMEAQAADSVLVALMFGIDLSASIDYSSFVDPVSGQFGYSALAGQSYLGLPFSMASSGQYNSATLRFEWTSSGSLGGQSWQTDGYLAWASDSVGGNLTTFDEPDSDVGDGSVTVVNGDGTYIIYTARSELGTGKNDPAKGKSRTRYEIQLYDEDFNPDFPFPKLIFAKGADVRNKDGTWRHTVRVSKKLRVSFNAAGLSPSPLGGIGAFQAGVTEIAAVPVPAAGVILAGGIGLLGILRRSRRTPVSNARN